MRYWAYHSQHHREPSSFIGKYFGIDSYIIYLDTFPCEIVDFQYPLSRFCIQESKAILKPSVKLSYWRLIYVPAELAPPSQNPTAQIRAPALVKTLIVSDNDSETDPGSSPPTKALETLPGDYQAKMKLVR